MRKNYFFLAAASALMLASCSSESNEPVNKPIEKENIALKTLSASSQAGRVKTYGTRGEKSDRLQLVATIAPVEESLAAVHNWSATGISIANGTAYVSWHSNYQATENPADMWGGALDAITIDGLTIATTQTSATCKFNNVVAANGNIYLPITSYKNGAVVGRVATDGQSIVPIKVPGSSANAIKVDGTTLYVATGFNGGAYSLPAAFTDESAVTTIKDGTSFGGKYIDGGYVLRTNATNALLLPLNGGTEIDLGAPLTSQEKYAGKYTEEGGWEDAGNLSQYYGKHTMAVDGDYIYVAGGIGTAAGEGEDSGHNGLRVYNKSGELLWENGTNTTAVCVAGDYVYAATGAGLRVYKKYVAPTEAGKKGTLELYAFEVMTYDENGKAAGTTDADGNHVAPEAGTTAHSCNFVAVDEATGYIFVANGQSGVYVFKLNEPAPEPAE